MRHGMRDMMRAISSDRLRSPSTPPPGSSPRSGGGHRASARVRWPPSPTLRHARPLHMAGFPGTDAKPSRVSRRNGSPGSGGRYSASPAKRRISANRKSNGDRCRKHRETVFSVRRRACRDRETDRAPSRAPARQPQQMDRALPERIDERFCLRHRSDQGGFGFHHTVARNATISVPTRPGSSRWGK